MVETKAFILEGAGFAYNGVAALHDLSLSLPPGRFYGVVGPNGSGKTTLLDLLAGGKRPGSGTISFFGRPLDHYRRRDLARLIALVPQEFAIDFAFRVEEVVLMGRHPYMGRFGGPTAEDLRLAETAMELIGIGRFRNRFVSELSGGEKQRVVVARALAQDTPVILFDEATSNLDIRFTLQIFQVARGLVRHKNRTVLAVIHNLNLAAAYCDELIFMKEGRIVRHGPTGVVLTPATIREVFGVESEVRPDPFSRARQVFFRYRS